MELEKVFEAMLKSEDYEPHSYVEKKLKRINELKEEV